MFRRFSNFVLSESFMPSDADHVILEVPLAWICDKLLQKGSAVLSFVPSCVLFGW